MTCDPAGIADASVVTDQIFAPSMMTRGLLHTLWPSHSLPSFSAFHCSEGLTCPLTRVDAAKMEIPSAMTALSSNPMRMVRFIWNCLLMDCLSRRPTLYAICAARSKQHVRLAQLGYIEAHVFSARAANALALACMAAMRRHPLGEPSTTFSMLCIHSGRFSSRRKALMKG